MCKILEKNPHSTHFGVATPYPTTPDWHPGLFKFNRFAVIYAQLTLGSSYRAKILLKSHESITGNILHETLYSFLIPAQRIIRHV